VNDQSETGVVTGSPFIQSPGSLHDKDRSVGGQPLGSKPVTLSNSRTAAKTTTVDPTIFTSFLIVGS
jgi:hypothetical protein